MLHCSGGNFKKQFKRADRVGAKLACVIGESEARSQSVVVKQLLDNGEQQIVALSSIVDYITHYFKKD